jgi:histidine triad (HIT) family protein
MRFFLFIARSTIGRLFIGWIFAHMSFAIPVKRLHETETLLAFYHPKPSYPMHVLLVPKKAIGSLMDLKDDDSAFLTDVFRTVQSLVEELELAGTGYRLILNGGGFQEVPQLHFHLVSGISAPDIRETVTQLPADQEQVP